MAFASDSTTAPARPLLPLTFRPSTQVDDPRTLGELLAEIAAEIDRQEVKGTTPLLPVPAPLPSLTTALARRRAIFGAVAVDEPDTATEARAIHARRELHQALEWGFAFLDAFDLEPAALDVIDGAIARMDAVDGDTDREPYLAGGYNGAVDPTGEAEDDSDEFEGTALESHGLGFVRAGEDDTEDDELDDDRDPEPVAWIFGPSRREVAHV